jgi:hypothetical protein
MKKIFFRAFFLLVLELLFVNPTFPAKENNPWKLLIQQMQERLDSGSLGQDLRITFNNFPYEVFTEEELMSYTVRADGKVVVQKDDEVRVLRISPAEFIWIFKFLTKYNLEELPSNEPVLNDSASFSIILRAGNFKKGIRLYKRNNIKDREVIWQYLFRLGQTFFEGAGLRDKNDPVLAVCKGIVKEEEIDTDSDGTIDWLRLWVGFYSFKSGDTVIDFLGRRQNIFISQGNSEKEFFINTYLLKLDRFKLRDLLDLKIDSIEGDPAGPYKMDMGFDSPRYDRDNYRTRPNCVLKNKGKWEFNINLNQAVIIEIKKGKSADRQDLWWFHAVEISPKKLKLEGREDLILRLNDEAAVLGFSGCMSSFLRLCDLSLGSALLEIGWRLPDRDLLQKRIGLFKELIARDSQGQTRHDYQASLKVLQDCDRELEASLELEIDITYCIPPAMDVK